jgi:DNA helicase-2/ATP-dependent DNA helicase PcrA
VNPASEIDLVRIVNVPARGIGAKTIEAMRHMARENGMPISEVLIDRQFIDSVRTKASRAAIEKFGALLVELRAMPRWPVSALLDRILDATDYRGYLVETPDPLSDERLENVEELRRAVREYDSEHPRGSLEEFLNETALVRSRSDEAPDEPRVTLMTLHAAKGLEFRYVFLAALEEGLLPHSRSLDTETGIEEERRLFYVGITRAQKRLTLSYAKTRMQGPGAGYTAPSRFLSEIPSELLDGSLRARSDLSFFEDTASYVPEYDSSEPPFSPGDRVVHQRFGLGNVIDISGFGPSARVTVDFEQHGPRKLILEFANLKKSSLHGG